MSAIILWWIPQVFTKLGFSTLGKWKETNLVNLFENLPQFPIQPSLIIHPWVRIILKLQGVSYKVHCGIEQKFYFSTRSWSIFQILIIVWVIALARLMDISEGSGHCKYLEGYVYWHIKILETATFFQIEISFYTKL